MFYGVGTEAYDLGLAIIEALARDVSGHGADLIVLHLPSPRHHVIPYAHGTPRVYEEFLAEVKGRYQMVDPFNALVQAVGEGDGAEVVMPGGHYSILANGLVADELVPFVLRRFGAAAERQGDALGG
jgi:hypothetical protein